MKEKQIKHSDFEVHQTGCDRCSSVDLQHTASLSNACLIGAPMLRDHLADKYTKQHARTNKAKKQQFEASTKTTKAKVKQVTRYVAQELF